jgi:hypothetical protein
LARQNKKYDFSAVSAIHNALPEVEELVYKKKM